MFAKFVMSTVLLVSTLLFNSSVYAAGPDLSGKWRGDWKSEHNGHHGPMQARFNRVDARHYDVVFTGRFAKVIPFRYRATLEVTHTTPQGVHLAGSHRLGPLLGTFSYQAYATSCQFVANYSARRDHGQFRFTR